MIPSFFRGIARKTFSLLRYNQATTPSQMTVLLCFGVVSDVRRIGCVFEPDQNRVLDACDRTRFAINGSKNAFTV